MNTFLDAFATVLAFFYSLVPNYAIAIALLTLLVMIVVTPLTLKGTRSMMVMQQLQPEMKKIQQRYKDDREKLNAELLKFYKENDINPLGGCLPLLVQMPIFLVLYQVLRGLTRRATDMGFDVGWTSGQLGIGIDNPSVPPSVERVFDPAYLSPASDMYQALHGSTTMTAFGVDLAMSPSDALSSGIITFIPYLILIIVVAATGFIQQRQIQGRNPNAQVNPQQQMVMKILPIFLPVISFGLPAGLVLYFAISNLYRIGQQAFISRKVYGISRKDGKGGAKGNAKGSAKANQKKPRGKAGAGSAGVIDAKAKSDTTNGKSPKGSEASDDGGSADTETPEKPAPKSNQPAKRTTRTNRANSSGQRSGGSQPSLQPRARKRKR